MRWHRAGFRLYWRWKSRSLGGRPKIGADLRALIRRMSVENLLWGAPRIHGELLKLGFAVAQSTVAKYMIKRRDPSSQGWGTFLRNHAPHIAAMDLFVVPTISFNLLYVLVIVRLARRELVWINVTPHPTAEWIERQITEAFPWNEAPRYLIRDRERRAEKQGATSACKHLPLPNPSTSDVERSRAGLHFGRRRCYLVPFSFAPLLGFLWRSLAGSDVLMNGEVFQLRACFQLLTQPDRLRSSSCPPIP